MLEHTVLMLPVVWCLFCGRSQQAFPLHGMQHSVEGGSSYHAADVFFRLIGHNSLHLWCLQWCVYDTTVIWHWLVNNLAFSLHFYIGRCSWAPKTNKCFCDSFRLASCMLLSTYQMRTLVLFSICNDRSNLFELVVIVHVLRLVCISGLQKLNIFYQPAKMCQPQNNFH